MVGEKNRGVVKKSAGGVEKKDDKTEGKKLMEPKETPRQSNPYAKPILGKCYRCNQLGHRSSECPNRRTINIVEREEEEEVCCEPNGEDEYYEEVDDGIEPSYVIRRMMLAPKQEGSSQRYQLFRTRCTIGGRVFDLIVDSAATPVACRETSKPLHYRVD